MIQHGPEASVAEASAPSALTLQPNEALAAAAGRNTASHCCLHRKTSYEILVTIESTMLLDNQMASLTPEIFNYIKRSNFHQVLLLDFNCMWRDVVPRGRREVELALLDLLKQHKVVVII